MSCFLNAVFLFCLCWCHVSFLTRSFLGGCTSVSKGSVPCLITSKQVGFRFPSFRLKRRRLCPKDSPLGSRVLFCAEPAVGAACLEERPPQAWGAVTVNWTRLWSRRFSPALPARSAPGVWPAPLVCSDPICKNRPCWVRLDGSQFCGLVTSPVPTSSTARSSLHVRKVERTPGRCPPLAASHMLRLQLLRRSRRHIWSPPRDRWCGVRHARLRGDGSGRELVPDLFTVEPRGQGAGRAGPQPLAADAAPQLGLRSAVCWPPRPVTRPGPGTQDRGRRGCRCPAGPGLGPGQAGLFPLCGSERLGEVNIAQLQGGATSASVCGAERLTPSREGVRLWGALSLTGRFQPSLGRALAPLCRSGRNSAALLCVDP